MYLLDKISREHDVEHGTGETYCICTAILPGPLFLQKIVTALRGARSLLVKKVGGRANDPKSGFRTLYESGFHKVLSVVRISTNILLAACWTAGTAPYHLYLDRKSTRLNSSHRSLSRMPSSA